jgi:small subunit ribosomal protein S14
MAKTSSVQKSLKVIKLVNSTSKKRDSLKSKIYNKTLPLSERFEAVMKLSSLPRSSSSTRIRNRCEITGRARGFYRKFKLSRIQLRDMAAFGHLPGVIKSSW